MTQDRFIRSRHDHVTPRPRPAHAAPLRRPTTVAISVLAMAGLAIGIVVPSTSAPRAAAETEAEAALIIGEIVVKLQPGVEVAAVAAIAAATSTQTLVASRGLHILSIPLAPNRAEKVGEKAPKDQADELEKQWTEQSDDTIKELRESELVIFAERNVESSGDSTRFHYWPYGGRSDADGGLDDFELQPASLSLHLAAAHEIATGAGIIVAVLDTGAALAHPVLRDRLLPGYDYVDDDAEPWDRGNAADDDGDGLIDEGIGHGTHAAGLIALVAPDAKILPMRVLDSDGRGEVFAVAEAIHDSIAAGADVINLSFGILGDVDSKVLDEALKAAKDADIVIVAAAGNGSTDAKHWPAADNDVIAVGALDASTGQLASFSNFGDWVDVAAPGTGLISAVPYGYGTWSGTSMAAPLVAGHAALLQSALDRPDEAKVRKLLRDQSDKIEGRKVDKGLINLLKSLEKI